MTLPALVASDLDGTLLRSDGTVSAATIAALDRLSVHDIPFVMVTGRPIRWLEMVIDQTGVRGLVVCSNGAVIYDPADGTVLDRHPLTPELLDDVTRRMREEFPTAVFATETDTGLRHEPEYPVWESAAGLPGLLAEVVSEPAIKLLARVNGPAARAGLTAAVARHLDGVVEVTRSSREGLVEIAAAGITKATGLAWVADRLGVAPADIVAFGDMPNDLPMFAYAGHSVAMANAEPEIRATATAVTATNDEDGVARHLDRLLDAASTGAGAGSGGTSHPRPTDR